MKNTLKTEFPGIGDAQFHIRLTEGQISPYVLLPGAPERVELVKKQWKNAVDAGSDIFENRSPTRRHSQDEDTSKGAESAGDRTSSPIFS